MPASSDPRLVRTPHDLGRLVRDHRNHRGLSQQDLADRLGSNRSAIAHLEQGLRIPDGDLLGTVCEHLDIPRVLWAGYQTRKLTAGRADVLCHSLTYYTSWKSATSDERKRDKLVFAVKNNDTWYYRNRSTDPYKHAAKHLREHFPPCFERRTVIPVPRSVKTEDHAKAEWGSYLLAKAITEAGDDMFFCPAIARTETIRKSSDPNATQPRPTVREHLETLRLTREGQPPPGILLVDDVTTKGTTLVACARVLREAGWPGEVEALSVAYSRGRDEWEPGEGKSWLFEWNGQDDYPKRRARG